jgi:hypothetical protein
MLATYEKYKHWNDDRSMRMHAMVEEIHRCGSVREVHQEEMREWLCTCSVDQGPLTAPMLLRQWVVEEWKLKEMNTICGQFPVDGEDLQATSHDYVREMRGHFQLSQKEGIFMQPLQANASDDARWMRVMEVVIKTAQTSTAWDVHDVEMSLRKTTEAFACVESAMRNEMEAAARLRRTEIERQIAQVEAALEAALGIRHVEEAHLEGRSIRVEGRLAECAAHVAGLQSRLGELRAESANLAAEAQRREQEAAAAAAAAKAAADNAAKNSHVSRHHNQAPNPHGGRR